MEKLNFRDRLDLLFGNLIGFPPEGASALCACHDSRAIMEIEGEKFVGQFDGFISAQVGQSTEKFSNLKNAPLIILGYATRSQVPEIGEVVIRFDFSREVPDSSLRQQSGRAVFPAVQTMRLFVKVTTAKFPGRLLRSKQLGVLRNDKIYRFPPRPGAVYVLEEPVELVDDKGTTHMTLLEVNTKIIKSTLYPAAINTGSGIRLSLPRKPQGEIHYQVDDPGEIAISVTDNTGKEVFAAPPAKKSVGKYSENYKSLLHSQSLFYQIYRNGEAVSRRMPL